jgi:hypothetical protein
MGAATSEKKQVRKYMQCVANLAHSPQISLILNPDDQINN